MALEIDGGTVRSARIAVGAMATVPWRAREAKATLIGQRLTPETAPVAGRAAFDGAPPGRHNGFKIDLGARAVAVALMTASAPPRW